MVKRISNRRHNPYLYGRRNYFDGLSTTSTGSSFLGRPQYDPYYNAKASMWNNAVNTELFGTYQQNNPGVTGSWSPNLSSSAPANNNQNNPQGNNSSGYSYFGVKGNKGVALQTGVAGATSALSAAGYYNTPGGYDGSSKDILDLADPIYHLAGGRESAVGNGLSDAGKGLFNAGVTSGNSILMLAGGIAKVAGGLTNTMFGYSTDKEGRKRLANYQSVMNNLQLAGGSNDDVAAQLGQLSFGGANLNRKKYKNGWFNKKGTKAYKSDIRKETFSTSRGIAAVNNAVANADSDMDQNMIANFSAYGGPLGGMDALNYMLATDAMGNVEQASAGNNAGLYMQPMYRQLPVFAQGGSIHIDPRNKGKFNATKRRTGKTTEELTHSSNPLTRKRAIFAQNAAKWHHAFGGELNTQGGDFTNGMLFIDNGGSHESNPYEGVPMGMDEQGIPNLVEEGETIFRDYVFSKRIKVPEAIRNKYKLRGTGPITFAEASKKLSKESGERPNDPISMNGLEAIMSDLAMAQEDIRNKEQSRQFSEGGRLYAGGSKLKSWKKKGDIEANLKWLRDLYVKDGDTSAWDALFDSSGNIIAKKGSNTGLYDPNGAYMQAINKIYDPANFGNWTPEFKQQFVDRLKAINPTTYANLTVDNLASALSRDRLYNLATDGMVGGHHQIGELATALAEPNTAANNRYFIQGAVGEDPTPIEDYFDTPDANGRTWLENHPDLERVNATGIVRDPVDVDGVSTVYTDYFFRKKPTAGTSGANRYYMKGDNGEYSLVEGDNPYLTVQNAGYRQTSSRSNGDGMDYYYDPAEADDTGGKSKMSWLRYAPAVGLGISAITDALGWTNKPDHSNAEALLEASKSAGSYQPVEFRPVGNYLDYEPLDVQFAKNEMNAQSGATMRGISNISGGNRGTAMAGMLAADNNFLNQLGNLTRQAREYNAAQRAKVEEFNRGTNEFNSEGFLKADMANQSAASQSRDIRLKGAISAYDMMERADLAADARKSANLSGALTALGDIGREDIAWNQVRANAKSGVFGNMSDWYLWMNGLGSKPSTTNTTAKGGKIKRKKGLTI